MGNYLYIFKLDVPETGGVDIFLLHFVWFHLKVRSFAKLTLLIFSNSNVYVQPFNKSSDMRKVFYFYCQLQFSECATSPLWCHERSHMYICFVSLVLTDCLSGVQCKSKQTQTKWPRVALAQVFDGQEERSKENIRRPESVSDERCKPTSTFPTPACLSPSDLHPRLFWLITPNVVLIKTGGVKGFSSPEKRVQIVAQWQIPSLAWEEMHPDNAQVVPKWPEPD